MFKNKNIVVLLAGLLVSGIASFIEDKKMKDAVDEKFNEEFDSRVKEAVDKALAERV